MIKWLGKVVARIFDPLRRLLDPRQYALRYALAEADGQTVVLIQAPKSLGGGWWAAYQLAPDASAEQVTADLLERGIPAFSVWQEVSPGGVRTMIFIPPSPSGGLWKVEGLVPVSDPELVLAHLGHPGEREVVI